MNACHLRAEFVTIHFVSFALSEYYVVGSRECGSAPHGGDSSRVWLSSVRQETKLQLQLGPKEAPRCMIEHDWGVLFLVRELHNCRGISRPRCTYMWHICICRRATVTRTILCSVLFELWFLNHPIVLNTFSWRKSGNLTSRKYLKSWRSCSRFCFWRRSDVEVLNSQW